MTAYDFYIFCKGLFVLGIDIILWTCIILAFILVILGALDE